MGRPTVAIIGAGAGLEGVNPDDVRLTRTAVPADHPS